MADPITGVCIVEERTKAPADYEVIAFTTDNQDADLWKDRGLRKKVTRYLAFTRKKLEGRDDVLADISVQKEEAMTPHGWTTITTTYDSGEAALKKKQFIVRFIPRSETTSAVTEIYLTSGKARHNKPVESSPRSWEIKDLSLFLRFGPVVHSGPPVNGPAPVSLPYQYPVRDNHFGGTNTVTNPTITTAPSIIPMARSSPSRQGTMRSPEQIAQMTAIDGVPFQLSPVLVAASLPETISVTRLPLKSRDEILRAYEYDFSTERLVKQQAAYAS